AVGMLGASPGLTIPTDVPCFRFQPRGAGVDWRRFSAVDVERVAREVDVAALQEHITGVTFCNLDGERCPHCGQPADPVLLKVLRMAQLSIEYLLHCQEHLRTSLAQSAQHLQATRTELACAQNLASEQAAQLWGVKEENRRWKKLMATQQLLLQAGPSGYGKVREQNPGRSWQITPLLTVPVFPGFAERQKIKQVGQMEQEVEELKEKLRETQQQLVAEREAEKLRREQEMERAHQREEEGRRDLERWKEEERTKLHAEMDGLRQFFLAELKDIASRSSAMEGKLQELQAREAAVSHLGTLQDDDSEEMWWRTPSQAELERTVVQVSSGVPVCSSENKKGLKTWMAVSKYPGVHCQPQPQGMAEGCLLTDILQLVASEGDSDASEHPRVVGARFCAGTSSPLWHSQAVFIPAVTRQVTKVVAAEESSEEDGEEDALGGRRRLLEALRRNPNLLKKFRRILEEALEEKLESMGVKKVAKGISTQTYQHLRAVVRLQQQQKAEKFPSLLHLRDELIQTVMRKVRRCKKPGIALPRRLSIIPGTAVSTKGKLLERRLDATMQRPVGGVKSSQ
ncbi:DZI1L protein, partial [Chauna torquata]|nr:DZI1L protein [Chauna torquata]